MGHVFESPEKEPRRACAEAWGRRNRSRATGPRATGGPLRLGDELRGRTTTPTWCERMRGICNPSMRGSLNRCLLGHPIAVIANRDT